MHFTLSFVYDSKFRSFSLITFGFVIFGAKILYEKWANKILMKLTAGVKVLRNIFSKILNLIFVFQPDFLKGKAIFLENQNVTSRVTRGGGAQWSF